MPRPLLVCIIHSIKARLTWLQLAQKAAAVPVVVITGWDAPGAYERAREVGAIAYLRKPVEDKALLDAIAIAITHVP